MALDDFQESREERVQAVLDEIDVLERFFNDPEISRILNRATYDLASLKRRLRASSSVQESQP